MGNYGDKLIIGDTLHYINRILLSSRDGRRKYYGLILVELIFYHFALYRPHNDYKKLFSEIFSQIIFMFPKS